ncbi:energy-coupling factor transporter transmembrane protein EcfT [Cetobacterium somerae]|nr:energy-coupling factor transporter transmembrane protein EcfT [Cetobacterium sp. NK01]
MLKSSLLILFVLNLFIKDMKILGVLLCVGILLNIIYNKELYKHLKKLKFLIFIYLTTFLAQIYYHQEGEVLFKIFNVYVTKGGILNFASSFLRIINLILLSWLVNTQNILPKSLASYQKIIEDVIELIPEVFKIFKSKRKIKWFFRYILSQIKIKN